MAVAPELAGLVDYLSIALGDSSTYRGSTGIVPPPPVEESAIAGFAAPFRVGPPLIATSRIVDPAAADRLIADGVADAVGMTRALITDPDLPRKAADGRVDGRPPLHRLQHLHRALPRRDPDRVRSESSDRTRADVDAGSRREAAASRCRGRWPRRDGRRGGGACGGPRRRPLRVEDPPGRTGRARRRRSRPRRARGVSPTELRTSARRRRRAPRRARGGAARMPTPSSWPPAPGRTSPTFPSRRDSRPRGTFCAAAVPTGSGSWSPTGAETPRGSTRQRSWRRAATRSRSPSDRRPSARPCTPTSATSMPRVSTGPESRSGTTSSSLRGTAAAPRFTNIFAPELEAVMEADALVLALGRVPVRDLEVQGALEAGDRLSPRSLEEAILEGSLAGRAARSRARAAGRRGRRFARPTPSPAPQRGRSPRTGSRRHSRPRGRRRAIRPDRRCSSRPSTRRRARARRGRRPRPRPCSHARSPGRARSPPAARSSGRGKSGRFAGTAIRSAPARASPRVSSGK